MLDFDRSDFIRFLKNFPNQILETRELMKSVNVNLNVQTVQNILFSGMGGSAISGDLLVGYVFDELKIPAFVNRQYEIPAFVNANTLFIASSYSGNTEETLTATREAIKNNCRIVGISSGGKLETLCRENDFPLIKIPEGLPPRQALGYLFFSLLFLMEKLNLITSKSEEVKETFQLLNELLDRLNPQSSFGHNLANHIAQNLYHSIPIVYTAVPHFYPVPVRWRNQFNENSKILVFSNVFPELNHNEIMGWEGPKEVNKYFRAIILRDVEENPRVKKRVEITKNILKKRDVPVLEIFAEGKSRLARMFSLIYTGDWASYYLAMINEKDPFKIESIDLLKQKLQETAN